MTATGGAILAQHSSLLDMIFLDSGSSLTKLKDVHIYLHHHVWSDQISLLS